MSYGLHVINTSGEVLIDGALPCAFLHEKRSVSVSCPLYKTGNNSWDFTQIRPTAVLFTSPVTTPEPPFIAGYADGYRLAIGTLLGGPGNWEGFTVFHTDDLESSPSAATFTLHYAVFSRFGSLSSNDAYGFVVHAADGKQVFDSRKFPFILRGSFSYRYINNGGQFGGTEVSNDHREAIGEVLTAPGSNYWPVLSGLNQVQWASLYINNYGHGSFCKLSVRRESSTQWRYCMGLALFLHGDYYRPYTAMSDWKRVENMGGGLGGLNMFLWAQVPN